MKDDCIPFSESRIKKINRQIIVGQLLIISWLSVDILSKFFGMPNGIIDLLFYITIMPIGLLDPNMLLFSPILIFIPIIFFFSLFEFVFHNFRGKRNYALIERIQNIIKEKGLNILPDSSRFDAFLIIVLFYYGLSPIFIFFIRGIPSSPPGYIHLDLGPSSDLSLLYLTGLSQFILLIWFISRKHSVERLFITPLEPSYQYHPSYIGLIPLKKIFIVIDISLVKGHYISILIRKPLLETLFNTEAKIIYNRICDRFFLSKSFDSIPDWKGFNSFSLRLEFKIPTNLERLNYSIEVIKDASREYFKVINTNLAKNITALDIIDKMDDKKADLISFSLDFKKIPQDISRLINDLDKSKSNDEYFASLLLMQKITGKALIDKSKDANTDINSLFCDTKLTKSLVDELIFLSQNEKEEILRFLDSLNIESDYSKNPDELIMKLDMALKGLIRSLHLIYYQ